MSDKWDGKAREAVDALGFETDGPIQDLFASGMRAAYREALEEAARCIIPDGNPAVALERIRALMPGEKP